MPIKTRFLILANTRMSNLLPPINPYIGDQMTDILETDANESCQDAGLRNLPATDVAIHCGGLTTSSTLAEMHAALNLRMSTPPVSLLCLSPPPPASFSFLFHALGYPVTPRSRPSLSPFCFRLTLPTH
jgi:hypothetical protein